MLERHAFILLMGLALPLMSLEGLNDSEPILYPYGLEHGDKAMAKTDDGSTPEFFLKVNITFFSRTYQSLYVNSNGLLSFRDPTRSHRPSSFPKTDMPPVVAPFWADINNMYRGNIFYRESQNPQLLRRVTSDISSSFPHMSFTALSAFVATWDRVGYYGSKSSKANTFQVVLTTDGTLAFILFNYGNIEWTSGTSTGGDALTGLGGISAQAGLNSDDPKEYFNIPSSTTEDILYIGTTSNVNISSRWVFRVDDFALPNGCMYNDQFLHHGTTFWNSHSCDMQCRCTPHADILCQHQLCDPHESCQPSSGYHICQPASQKTCTAAGGAHYTTFDGRLFHLPGFCSYTLSKLCGDSGHLMNYTVEAKMGEQEVTTVPWPEQVKVVAYDQEIIIPTGRAGYVLVNGMQTLLPDTLADGKIRVYHSGFTVMVSTDFGLTVTFNGLYYVTVTVPLDYFNFTCGLCGTPNSDPSDDLETRNGTRAPSDQLFAESWCVTAINSSVERENPVVATCSNQTRTLYSSGVFCGVLADNKGPFSACTWALPSQNFLESCVYELCASSQTQEVLCLVLSSYVERCQAANITVGSWRKEGFCGIACPENSSYARCGTACPASCTNPDAPQSCTQSCRESCLCNPGFVLSAGTCVPLDQCGCTLDRHYYKLGDQVFLGDHCSRKCTCRGPSRGMVCEEHACGTYEKCSVVDAVRRCHPAPNGTCKVWGDPHYRTYDGLLYSHQSICRYTLTRSCGRLGPLTEFSVDVENEHRTPNAVSWTRLVELQVYGHHISISAAHKEDVYVNGTLSRLPMLLQSGKVQIHRIGSAAVVQTDFGLSVSYDWHQYVTVNLSGVYSGIVCGLCGNFNGDKADDFRTPSGSVVSETDRFVESWWDPDYSLICAVTKRVPACGLDMVALYLSNRYCGAITDPEGSFTDCNGTLDAHTYLTNCVYNVCVAGNSQQALCESIQGYAQQCQKRGITIQQWRDFIQCEMKCPIENTHYELCGASCQASCSNLSMPSNCPTPCEEGCQCDSGFVLNGTDCVPQGQCGCLYNGRQYLPGETWRGENCQTICRCNDTTGTSQCSNAACGKEEVCLNVGGVYECHVPPVGTCRASGGSHYTTFDGRRYSVLNNCTNILSELCVPSDVLPFFGVEIKGDHLGRSPVTAITEVSVLVKDHVIIFEKESRSTVKVDGVSVILPVRVDGQGLIIYQNGVHVVLKTGFGMTVTYDTFAVLVVLHSRYRGKTCGLCGNFNGLPADDVATQNVTQANNTYWLPVDLTSHGSTSSSDSCSETQLLCVNKTLFNSGSLCGIIKDPSGPFSLCHQDTDPSPYFSDCVDEHCRATGDSSALCQAIQTYAALCQAANVTISPWRNESFCALRCPAHSHYDPCGDPCQASCAASILGAHCGTACIEGCFCDDGFLRSGDSCVPASQCGCVHQGRYYNVGDLVWLSNCTQRCRCDFPGPLRCYNAACNPGQDCVVQNGRLGCLSAWATCVVTGDPHYLTFDGAMVHFQGTCAYEVAHTCHSSTDFSFRVIAENRNHRSPNVSFVSRVEVRLKSSDSEINVTFGGMNEAQVNGVMTSLPKSLGPLAHISKVGNMVVLLTSKGMEIRYRAGTLFIRVSRQHQSQLCGICGNYNWDPGDDKLLPSGEPARDDMEFGNSWRSDVNQASCQPGADVPPICQAPQDLEGPCEILTNTSGPFAECHWYEDPSRFHDSCAYDLCHHGRVDGMLCAALASYEGVCMLHGVSVLAWRALVKCPEEDPCEALVCTDTEWCGERQGEFGCYCQKEYNDQQKDNYDLNLTCAGDLIQVSISRCLLFEDGIPLDALQLTDRRCIGTPSGDRLLFSFVRRACGTQVQVNVTHTVYTNEIQGFMEKGSANGSQAVVDLPFSCVYGITINLLPPPGVRPVQAIVWSNLPASQERYQTTMFLYRDHQYSQHYIQSLILSVDDKVYVGLSTSGANPTTFVLTITACWATGDSDSSSGIRWDLITNQCPNPRDGTVVIEEDGVSTIGRFSFSVFQFISQSKQVYLHCKVQLCRIQEVACTRPCGRVQVAGTAREEESPTLSVGPIRMQEDYAGAEALVGKGTSLRCPLVLFLLVLQSIFLLHG